MIKHLTLHDSFEFIDEDSSDKLKAYYESRTFSINYFEQYKSNLHECLFEYSPINHNSLPLFKREIEKNKFSKIRRILSNKTLTNELIEQYIDVFSDENMFSLTKLTAPLNKNILIKLFEKNKQPRIRNVRDLNKWTNLNYLITYQIVPMSLLRKYKRHYSLIEAITWQTLSTSFLKEIIFNKKNNANHETLTHLRYIFEYQKLDIVFISEILEFLKVHPISSLAYFHDRKQVSMHEYFFNIMMCNKKINQEELIRYFLI